ncbi:uncharacterized protein LOC126734493 [Anthonomus grandis grandis]|uniref:uncharacterized protein LOC126734493 n=1 Tax=Anthonomus grandis grandis TaxID=2921223 RepID=UPI0021668EF7|nr:uncharacterized protein LOC126734493 [Anthonomus grandis grandis]
MTDISDGYGYDFDQDKEYTLPEKSKKKKECRIKIRGRYINIPTRSSSSESECEESDLESHLTRNNPGCSTSSYKTSNSAMQFKVNSKTEIKKSSHPSSVQLQTNFNRNISGCSTTLTLNTSKQKVPLVKDGNIEDPETEYYNSYNTATSHDTTDSKEDNLINETNKKLTRKRQKNTSEWACNIRKTKFDRGLEYISSRKKVVPAREIKNKKDCLQKCLFKCSRIISDEQRKEIFKNYYLLSAVEKKNYILNTTKVDSPWRRRKGKKPDNSRKKRTFIYYFELNGQPIQVCKDFYTGTLCISQKPIYTTHKNKTVTNTLTKSIQGKHQKRVTSPEAIDFVKEHINLVPRVESHYCRKNRNKEYVESGLSIKKLYELYVDLAKEREKAPVSFSVYRKTFCNNFNIAFHKPRKDRCDTCA